MVDEAGARNDLAFSLVFIDYGDGAGDRVPTKTGATYSKDILAARNPRRPPVCVSMLPVRRPEIVNRPYQLSRANP